MVATRTACLVGAALAARAALATTGATPPTAAPPGRTAVGTIVSIDRARRSFALATPAGRLHVAFDRNTSVYLVNRVGTVRQLAVGTVARVGYGDAPPRAFWIELEGRRPEALRAQSPVTSARRTPASRTPRRERPRAPARAPPTG